MSTTPSADAKAVVKALAALTTQVRRLADTRQSDFVLSADATDDDATTDDDALRHMLTDALTAEHYRRAREQTVASPEEHSAGMADVVMGIVSICRAAEATTPIDDAVYCPLCPDAPRLLTPADADHHFRTKHPEQRLNTSGAWPLLVPDDATTTADDGPRCVCGDPIQLRDPIDPDSWIHSPGSDTPCLHARRACDERGPWGDAHACIRPAGHPDDHEALDGCGWRTGFCGSGQHKPHPGFTCAEVDASQPYFRVRWEQEQQARAADEHERCITHFHGACDGTTRDCAFPTPGTGRRRSLRVLLNRLNNGVTLTPDEVQLLTRHVATEITEHNTARAVAAGNKRHVQTLVPALERAEADANHNAGLVADAVRRAESAERDLRTLRTGLRAAGGDPTQIQNLWAQLRLRNRQWAEAKREARAFRSTLEEEGGDVRLVDEMLETVANAEARAREAQATIERVRAMATDAKARYAHGRNDYEIGKHDLAGTILGALDGTDQPTTEA